METNRPEDADRNNPANPTPETQDTNDRLARLSLSEESSHAGDGPESNESQKPGEKDRRERAAPDASDEEENTRTYRISTLVQGEDPDADEQRQERNIRPDELFDIVFNFDAPREIDLKVKIKGDFNVTFL
ncbi:hypothetical protein BJX61DRAFT_542501 [Aspergillus egyptiacus]|nr:hypothetical protein BJX61DRAFT_542501 [Aspergillus egyptiacus]